MRFFKSGKLSEEMIRDRLKGLGVTADEVESLIVSDDGVITLIMTASEQTIEEDEKLRYQIEMALKALNGVSAVRVVLTAQAERRPQRPSKPQKTSSVGTLSLPGVRGIIAVASAKGGVGKSTLALNLAIALQKTGLRVGLLDADVYGPSVPTMTGTVETRPPYRKGQKLTPVDAFGLKLMSIGYVTEQSDAMIWRGPMVVSAITQMMRDVDWGELDLLLIDTPPGTGDAQLTLAQKVAMTGAIIVSTPQTVALADVRRGVSLFQKTGVPILGLVENMAWFEDPTSGERSYVFGKGGAKAMADELSLPFLGEVPLVTDIREGGDCGTPIASTQSRSAHYFDALAQALLDKLGTAAGPVAPKIVFE